MINTYLPPIETPESTNCKIFLAGTIDNGQSENWQGEFINYMNKNYDNIDIYNPRRSFEFIKQESKEFKEQVNWELKHLEKADIIIMNILNNSKSPISLLELGLYATSKKMLVICEPNFWRRGNVVMLCEKYNIPLYNHISEITLDLDKIIKGV